MVQEMNLDVLGVVKADPTFSAKVGRVVLVLKFVVA
jgi:hypothetical protein